MVFIVGDVKFKAVLRIKRERASDKDLRKLLTKKKKKSYFPKRKFLLKKKKKVNFFILTFIKYRKHTFPLEKSNLKAESWRTYIVYK